MLVIDSNSLIVLILGLMNPKHLGTHKTASFYDIEDYEELLIFIEGKLENLLIIPNVWTEVDNLLNNFSGDEKYEYIKHLIISIQKTSEKYLETIIVNEMYEFIDIGITDSLLLHLAKETGFLITADSILSDYAKANNILVYDMVSIKNNKLLKY